jgi:hypothetical protein
MVHMCLLCEWSVFGSIFWTVIKGGVNRCISNIVQCLEHKVITYYRRYVDDLLIMYDQSRIKVDKILNFINHVDNHFEFIISVYMGFL